MLRKKLIKKPLKYKDHSVRYNFYLGKAMHVFQICVPKDRFLIYLLQVDIACMGLGALNWIFSWLN